MGRFGSAVRGSTFNAGGAFFEPGDFVVRVDAVRYFTTRKDEDAVVIECTILESNNPRFKLGSPVSQMMMKRHESFGGNMAQFVAVATGVEMEEITSMSEDEIDAEFEKVVAADNPLAGTILGVQVFMTQTKKKTDFTKVVWKNEAELRAKIADLAKLAKGLKPAEQPKAA